MKYIQLRKILFLDKDIAFLRFLPKNREDALRVAIGGIEFTAYVDLRAKGSTVGDVKEDEIPRGINRVLRFVVDIKVPVIDPNDPIWYKMDPPTQTIQELASAWRAFEANLYGIVRNELGQYWLPNSHEIESMPDRDLLVNLAIFDPETNQYRQFCTGSVTFESRVPNLDWLIDSDRWKKLGTYIEAGYKPDLSLVFARNARSYLRQKEYRLAVVEACISLERAIAKAAPIVLSDQQMQQVNRFLSSDSLNDKVKEVLPLLMINKGEVDFDYNQCAKAVDLRNLVVHKACVNINQREATLAVSEIERIVRILNDRIFFEITERIISK